VAGNTISKLNHARAAAGIDDGKAKGSIKQGNEHVASQIFRRAGFYFGQRRGVSGIRRQHHLRAARRPAAHGHTRCRHRLRELGKELANDQHLGIDRACFIAFSHFHWDHIQGLPFFKPAYDPRRTFTLSAIGRERRSMDLRSIFETQMQEKYFPVTLDDMGAENRVSAD
jgi:hypothetical protein